MKKLLLLSFLTYLSPLLGGFGGSYGYAQTAAPDIEWQRCYGGGGHDGVTGAVFGTPWQPDEVGIFDGNVVVLNDGSMVFATNVGIGVNATTGANEYDGDAAPVSANYQFGVINWIVKVSPRGTIIWKKHLTPFIVQFITKTNDGGFLISGNAVISPNLPLPFGDDIIVKIDATGTEQWRKVLHNWSRTSSGDKSIFYTKHVKPTNDGGYIAVSMEALEEPNFSGTFACDSTHTFGMGSTTFSISKTDALGNIVWQRCIATPGQPHGIRTIGTANCRRRLCVGRFYDSRRNTRG